MHIQISNVLISRSVTRGSVTTRVAAYRAAARPEQVGAADCLKYLLSVIYLLNVSNIYLIPTIYAVTR